MDKSVLTFVAFAVFVAISEAIEELNAVCEPDIIVGVNAFTNAIVVNSESITAPAAVTLVVSAVTFAVLVATSDAIDELNEVNEPDILTANCAEPLMIPLGS